MRPRRTQAPGWRAIVGVIALYALLLQPFLAAAAPAFGFALAGVLCAPAEGGAPTHDGAATQHHQCCMAAQFTGPALPPAGEGVAVDWPARCDSTLSWRPEAERPKTGPPVHAHAPRGPPSA